MALVSGRSRATRACPASALPLDEGRQHAIAAVDDGRAGGGELQRRNRQAVAVRHRHRLDLAPALRHLRRGDRPELRLHRLEQLHVLQERLQARRAGLQRQLRRADVGGVHEDLRDRQRPARGMQVLDGEAAGGERLAHVDRGLGLGDALVEHHGEGDRLEDRAELERAARDLVGCAPHRGSCRDAPDRPRGARRRRAPRRSRHRGRGRPLPAPRSGAWRRRARSRPHAARRCRATGAPARGRRAWHPARPRRRRPRRRSARCRRRPCCRC